MAFKQFSNYLEEKNGDFFTLRGDGDYADVIFLYTSYNDMMVCDTHWLSTPSYSGYVQCLREDAPSCPACTYGERGIRRQTSLFIPLYNLSKQKIEFWDRTSNFEYVINTMVFKNYPNPSEFVFRVTRRGAPRDVNTKYDIVLVGRNTSYPFEKIMADFNISFPEGYNTICKAMTVEEMENCLRNSKSASPNEVGDYNFTPRPRGAAASTEQETTPEPPQIDVDIPEYGSAPAVEPPAVETPAEPKSQEEIQDYIADVADISETDDSIEDVDF